MTTESLAKMATVDRMCGFFRRYLNRFWGMRPEYLQDYLNWYVYLLRAKRAKGKWPMDRRIIRHLLLAQTTFKRARSAKERAAKARTLDEKGR